MKILLIFESNQPFELAEKQNLQRSNQKPLSDLQ